MIRSTANMRLVAQNSELTVRVSALAALSKESDAGAEQYIAAYRELLERIAEEALNSNYSGICELCQYLQVAVGSLEQNPKKLSEETYQLLQDWPGLVSTYLEAPTEKQAREALITHLRSPALSMSISDEDAAILSMMLDEDPSISGEDTVTISADSVAGESFLDDFDFTAQASGGVELPSKDLVVALLNQLKIMQEPLDNLLATTVFGQTGAREFQSAAEIYAGYLQRFSEATMEVGLTGLYLVTQHARENLGILTDSGSAPPTGAMDTLNNLITLIKSYLKAPYAPKNSQELVGFLSDSGWPQPLSSEQAQDLLALFQNIAQPADKQEQASSEDDDEVEQGSGSPRIATAEDVSLALPDDVDDFLFEIMMEELPEQTAQFSEAVQNLIAGGSMEDVKVAQRMAHSLKGAGNTIGIKGIAELTHNMEDILIELSEQEALPTKALSMTMMHVVDCLEAMGEALNGNGEPPEDAQAVLQEVLDWGHRIDVEGLPKEDDRSEDIADADEKSVLSDSLPADELSVSVGMSALTDSMQAMPALMDSDDSMVAMPALPARSQASKNKKSNSDSVTVRVPANLVDNMLRLAGEATIMNGLMHERVRQSLQQIKNLQGEFNRMYSLGSELERLIDIKDFSSGNINANAAHTEFDSLEMDQYNELHTASRMLAETATDSQELGSQIKQELLSLEDMLVDQDILNNETQYAVTDVRMVSVKSVVSKLQRSVRQTARLTDKQVKLQVNGEDTRIDGDVLSDLGDPLMHLLRNAIDHGIESPEQRTQAGKEVEGTIQLDFHREGNNIVVRCRDDGGGIDFDAIKRKAESLGILQPGQEATQDDLKRILLMSNFSTRDEVTQTSGRGVGMDAVYSAIIEMGGSLALESEAGIGTLFELRVPLTLVTSHALLVRQGPSLLAISDHGVLQILYGQDGVLEEEGDSVFYRLGEQRYPARFLESILDLPADRRASDRSKRPVFLVQDEMGISAVIVGEVLESLNIVVKGFGHYVPEPVGIVGAAILGDGSVRPVIDLPDLLRHARVAKMPMIMAPEKTGDYKPSRAMVMVVDDSRSARYVMTKVVEAAGYIVRPAHDGMEALKLLEARPADLVLSDMEMPRMNGIELTQQIRMNSQLSHIPVIMITSRSTKKHRLEAETAGVNGYFNKPFDEVELIKEVKELLSFMNTQEARQIS